VFNLLEGEAAEPVGVGDQVNGFTVIELNGAVDFDDREYSMPGDNIYAAIAEALNLDRLPAAPAVVGQA
jgi:hypothetical protein